MEKVVFLGGSCGDTTWRNKLIPKLESVGVKYFNPVVEDWNEEAQKAEEYAINYSDTILMLISPRTSSTYSLYELAKYTNTNRKVIFTYLDEDEDKSFTTHEIKALRKIKSDLKSYKNSVTYSVRTPNGYDVLFTIRDESTEGVLMQMQKLEIHFATKGFTQTEKKTYKPYKSSSEGSSAGSSAGSSTGSELATEKQASLIKAKWPTEWKDGMTKKEANSLISQKYGN